jgi:heat shock protein HslJ
VVRKVHKHIDVAAAWVEVIARSRTHELKQRHAAPRAGGSDAVEVVGDEADHAESLPRKSANRNGQSRDRRGEAADGRVADAAPVRADQVRGRTGEVSGFVGGTIMSMIRIVPSLAAAAVIVVTLASCASSPDPRAAAPGSGTPTLLPSIDRTEWTCVELIGADGKPIAVTDQPPSLFISAEGRASGFAGVNRYCAEATVGNAINYDNVPLRFGPVGATRMAGPHGARERVHVDARRGTVGRDRLRSARCGAHAPQRARRLRAVRASAGAVAGTRSRRSRGARPTTRVAPVGGGARSPLRAKKQAASVVRPRRL